MGVSENSVPLNPMVLLIIIPIKWLFHWEYTLFSDKPISFCFFLWVPLFQNGLIKCCFHFLLADTGKFKAQFPLVFQWNCAVWCCKKKWPQSELGSTPICFYPRSNDGHVFEQAFWKLGGGGGGGLLGGCNQTFWDILGDPMWPCLRKWHHLGIGTGFEFPKTWAINNTRY